MEERIEELAKSYGVNTFHCWVSSKGKLMVQMNNHKITLSYDKYGLWVCTKNDSYYVNGRNAIKAIELLNS